VEAAASPRSVALSWENDPACLGREALSRSIEGALGHTVFHASEPPSATVEGKATRVARGYEARIVLRTGETISAEKTLFTEGKCDRLDDAVAVVIALMIDALGEPAAPALPPEPAPLLTIPETPARPPAPPAPGEPALRLALGTAVGASWGLLPATAARASLRGQIDAARLPSLVVGVHGHAPRTVLDAGSGLTLSGWSAEALVCPLSVASERLMAGGCGGLGGGWLSASPISLVAASGRSSRLLHASLGGSLGARLAGPLWLSLGVDLWAPLWRDRFGLRERDGTFVELHRPWPLIPAVSLAIELRSP
jgi:hypothetical protein